MPRAAIALGSNLPGGAGSREANLEGAVEALGRMGQVVARSRWYDTPPVGYTEQPRFLNGAVILETTRTPQALLRKLLEVELEFGRDRSHAIVKGPRTLDMDLLLYDDRLVQEEDLVVPHPEMHTRRFVLEPLAAIAPGWVHPVLQKTVEELLLGVS